MNNITEKREKVKGGKSPTFGKSRRFEFMSDKLVAEEKIINSRIILYYGRFYGFKPNYRF